MKCLKPGHGAFECKNSQGAKGPNENQFSRIAMTEKSSKISIASKVLHKHYFFQEVDINKLNPVKHSLEDNPP